MKHYMVDGYLPTIGIECHVQLATHTKLFSSVNNDAREAPPNTLVSHICFGLPGALPVLNEKAVELAVRASYALGSSPQSFSKFDRKHYFYPDLPKGYQISQYDEPIILGGEIVLQVDGAQKTVRITRAHLEEDAGKSTHPEGKDYSLVDLNRAGTPLLEIVSEPDMHSGAEAKAFARELYLRMKYSGVSDANLYYGNMRFDVNVSVSNVEGELGIRSETKNLNSFKSVEKAVEYEIKRQIELLKNDEKVVQETRGWHDDKQKTFSQRSKEDAHDYRYFPEPDLPPIVIDEEWAENIKLSLPTLPNEWREKLKTIDIDSTAIEELLDAEIEDDKVSYLDILDELSSDVELAKRYANWVVNIFVPTYRQSHKFIESGEDRKRLVTEVHKMVANNELSSTNAKLLLVDIIESQSVPTNIKVFAEERGLLQVSDSGEIDVIVSAVLSENQQAVEDIKSGEMKAIGFLVGQVMKRSVGKANPQMAQELIKKQLGV